MERIEGRWTEDGRTDGQRHDIPATHIEMTKSEFHHFAVGDFVEALVDSWVSALAVESDLVVASDDHGHALTDVVEVEDTQELILQVLAVYVHQDHAGSARLQQVMFMDRQTCLVLMYSYQVIVHHTEVNDTTVWHIPLNQ